MLVGGKGWEWMSVGEGGRRTTLAGYELADLAAVGAVDVGEEGGEAGNGDVLRQEVEFGDSIPNFGLGRELEVEGQLKLWAVLISAQRTMSMMKTLGAIGNSLLCPRFSTSLASSGVATTVVMETDAASRTHPRLVRCMATMVRSRRTVQLRPGNTNPYDNGRCWRREVGGSSGAGGSSQYEGCLQTAGGEYRWDGIIVWCS